MLPIKSRWHWKLQQWYVESMAKKTNINRGESGWTVRVVRDGVEYSKYFRFSDGGIRASYSQAEKYLEELLAELGPRQWRKGPRAKASNNSSGVTGVSKNIHGRWVATWQEDRKQRFKTFKTKRAAIEHRKQKIQSLSE